MPNEIELTITDLAYAAGIIDGEGTIGIYGHRKNASKYKYSDLVVQVANTKVELIQWLQFKFGGKFCFFQPHRLRQSSFYNWRLYNKKAVEFIKLILPYLKIKRANAELAIEYQSRKGRKGQHLTDTKRALQEVDRLLMHQYNKTGCDSHE
jgi:hypothetical protein